eukprot:CAMPEP_0178719200 /NCGR_PEP_ID=MMETSP0699-20121125/23003_1 /TAXON_ID=265572 /ORGANISM="Extubocellulus spinifer, Strain CCMP396" /LENGTH=429 /DNA_ID=CAMNT_0020369431 /DNA_START=279 /DNA_END=1568 /DNA_ORIENTATION=-
MKDRITIATWSTIVLLHAGCYYNHHHSANAFVFQSNSPNIAKRPHRVINSPLTLLRSKAEDATADLAVTTDDTSNDSDIEKQPTAVRAPLKYVGPYPCLALRFPNLATQSQRERNVTGISLDFVLDTAANTNTINSQVAKELGLEVVGEALPGVGAGGAISGGDTFMLGDAQLDGLPKDESFTFMKGLTASALPVASPASAGLLGLYFFNCFQGGVCFDWGGNSAAPVPSDPASNTTFPSVTFYSDKNDMGGALDGLKRAPIKPLPVSNLPSVELQINGQAVPALLDTGSPISVLNAEAARLAGVETTMKVESESGGGGGISVGNPFAKLAKGIKSAQAAARGDVLLVAGAAGERIELVKSQSAVDVGVGGFRDDIVELGKHNIYVGDLPGLAALGGLGGSGAQPAVVLGMDVLRTRPRMVYREDEVYL